MNIQENKKETLTKTELQEKMMNSHLSFDLLTFDQAVNIVEDCKKKNVDLPVFVMLDDEITFEDVGYIGNPNSVIETEDDENYVSKDINTMVLHQGTIGDNKEILEKVKDHIKCIFV